MPFQKKEIPEWLKTGSNTDPSSNFTVPKAVPVTGSKSSAKGRRKSTIKKDPQSSDFDLKKDKNGLVIHVWDKVVKFEKQDGTFLLNSTWEHISKSIELNEIPFDLVPILNEANCKFVKGQLIVSLFDYRKPVEPNGPSADQDPLQPRTIILKPTPRSLLADVMHIARSVPEGLSQEEVLHVESDLLLLHNQDLDLRVDEPSITVKFAMQNVESSLTPPKIKCMKNSSELEAEEAERREMKELMLSMDETRPKRRFFETLGGSSLIEEIRKKRSQQTATYLQGSGSKKLKVKKPFQENAPPGYKLVRWLQFERETERGKVITVLKFYEGPDGKFKAILRHGPANIALGECGFKEVDFDSSTIAENYAASFIDSYTLENQLVLDSNTSEKPQISENALAPQNNLQNADNDSRVEVSTQNYVSQSIQHLVQPKVVATTATASAKCPPAELSPNTLVSSLTPQQLAEYQMAMKRQLLQQQMQQHLESQSSILSQNLPPSRPPAQTPVILPQFPNFQLNQFQQQLQLQQMQQQNIQNMFNQQQAMRQQQAMMSQELTPQQQQLIAAQRKQHFEALRQQQLLNSQEMHPQSPQNQQRPSVNFLLSLAQRQALAALQNKQLLTPAQNQVLDGLLQQPNLSVQHKQIISSMRAQYAAANISPTNIYVSQAGVETLATNSPKVAMPLQPASQQPQAQQLQQLHIPQQNFMSQPRSAAQIQQMLTLQQQQTLAALQQQGLNPQQLRLMYILQQRPSQYPDQQAILRALQAKQAQSAYQQQAFLLQTQAHALKNKLPHQQAFSGQMANSTMMSASPNLSQPISKMPDSMSQLSPQEQNSIHMNQMQQQQSLQAQMQAQIQAQIRQQALAQLQQQAIQLQRPFLHPNQQQQFLARLQQQAMLNPMGPMSPQQLMPLNMAQAMHPLFPGMSMPTGSMPASSLQPSLTPGNVLHGSQPPPAS